jgi:hypothetical protein
MTSNQRGISALLDQIVDQKRLDDKESWLGVSGVVEVIWTLPTATVSLANCE